MSDDEEYYDEYYEEIWIEEPEPGIAVCLPLCSHLSPAHIWIQLNQLNLSDE